MGKTITLRLSDEVYQVFVLSFIPNSVNIPTLARTSERSRALNQIHGVTGSERGVSFMKLMKRKK